MAHFAGVAKESDRPAQQRGLAMKELIDVILALGNRFVYVTQHGAAPLYPIFPWMGYSVVAQPFGGGIVFSYAGDDEPYAILLEPGKCWSFQEYGMVPVNALFDEQTWEVLKNALGDALDDVEV
jgi:hypothetical protein